MTKMTNNEIAQRDQDAGTLDVLPPAQSASVAAQQMLRAHAAMMQDAWELASKMVMTTMVPPRFLRKPEDATAAILYGAELGLNPIQSLQRVIPIHGMPTLESRTMVGLLKARGYKIRTVEQSDTSVTVEGESPDGERATSTWTIGRAQKAGYLKNSKYETDPQAMLKAKCQAEVCRELAPDVLMGISYSREEMESEGFSSAPASSPRAARTRPVSTDEIFAAEVPLDKPVSSEDPDNPTSNPRSAAEQAQVTHVRAALPPETPDGAVSEDQGDGPADLQPAPSEQTETVPEPVDERTAGVAVDADQAIADMEAAACFTAAADREAKATSKKVAAKRSTAPAANPDKPRSRMRQALEKRLFALLKDAGLDGDENRDGRIAVYRSIMEDESIGSTDDLDDVAVSKVSDQLYAWQQQNVLGDEIGDILAIAVAAEETAKATADAPISEGNIE